MAKESKSIETDVEIMQSVDLAIESLPTIELVGREYECSVISFYDFAAISGFWQDLGKDLDAQHKACAVLQTLLYPEPDFIKPRNDEKLKLLLEPEDMQILQMELNIVYFTQQLQTQEVTEKERKSIQTAIDKFTEKRDDFRRNRAGQTVSSLVARMSENMVKGLDKASDKDKRIITAGKFSGLSKEDIEIYNKVAQKVDH